MRSPLCDDEFDKQPQCLITRVGGSRICKWMWGLLRAVGAAQLGSTCLSSPDPGWKSSGYVGNVLPRGRAIHTGAFKPLLGWAVSHVHLHSTANQSQRGGAPHAAAQPGGARACWLNRVTVYQRGRVCLQPPGHEAWRTIVGDQVPKGQNLKSTAVLDLGTGGRPLTWTGVEALHGPLVSLIRERLRQGRLPWRRGGFGQLSQPRCKALSWPATPSPHLRGLLPHQLVEHSLPPIQIFSPFRRLVNIVF